MSVTLHQGNLLKQIINERVPTNFIVINDVIEFSGLPLINLLVESHASRGNEIHFLWYEYRQPPEFVKEIDEKYPNLLKLYNLFQDPLKWLSKEDTTPPLSFDSIVSFLVNNIREGSKKSVVILDSIMYPLELSDLTSMLRTINKLVQYQLPKSNAPSFQLIVILHSDVYDSENIVHSNLNHMATTLITMEGHLSSEKTGKMTVLHRGRKPKTLKEAYTAWLGANGCFSYEEFKPQKTEVAKIPQQNEPELELTTFRLSLREDEMESRKKLVLPYIRKKQEEEKGTILYEPDENDDWDEEDPDDDLEI